MSREHDGVTTFGIDMEQDTPPAARAFRVEPAPASAPASAPATAAQVLASATQAATDTINVVAKTLAPLAQRPKQVVGKTVTEAQSKAREEIGQIKIALENHLDFPFMKADTQPLYGLHDWCTTEWTYHLETNPSISGVLGEALGYEEHTSTNLEPSQALAVFIKEQTQKALPFSQWRSILAFQNAALNHTKSLDIEAHAFYPHQSLRSEALFRRDFPLGVDDRVANRRYKFAIENSGAFLVRHREDKRTTVAVYGLIVLLGIFIIVYLLLATVGNPDVWTLNSTVADPSGATYTTDIKKRTKERGIVASVMQALTFSALVNASLDKIGKIDPSTSTVLIGMFLGNTFGFVLDVMLAQDEGLREYMWSPQMGMRYALGSLASERFGRFFVTVLFDMFFTVILFKHFYSKLVHVAGFSQNGREWMANFVVSAVLGILTFAVYANLTRFEWAYPSGVEAVDDQWISGPTMLLATIIMNMVYVTSETRVRIDEPGINDPSVKLVMTFVTFVLLYLLQTADFLDPSLDEDFSTDVTADWRDWNLPLRGVCQTQSKAGLGTLIFTAITCLSLGGVIFGTSEQSLSGLQAEFCPSKSMRSSGPAEHTLRRQMSIKLKPVKAADRRSGHCCLFLSYLMSIFLLMLFFSFTPFVNHDGSLPRNDTLWREACDSNDKDVLNLYGLS